jgi:hypothetical protein
MRRPGPGIAGLPMRERRSDSTCSIRDGSGTRGRDRSGASFFAEDGTDGTIVPYDDVTIWSLDK